ncbi:hypothetical protein P7C70_g4186, partial [Phenoliferia sp. Uapishka_3]
MAALAGAALNPILLNVIAQHLDQLPPQPTSRDQRDRVVSLINFAVNVPPAWPAVRLRLNQKLFLSSSARCQQFVGAQQAAQGAAWHHSTLVVIFSGDSLQVLDEAGIFAGLREMPFLTTLEIIHLAGGIGEEILQFPSLAHLSSLKIACVVHPSNLIAPNLPLLPHFHLRNLVFVHGVNAAPFTAPQRFYAALLLAGVGSLRSLDTVITPDPPLQNALVIQLPALSPLITTLTLFFNTDVAILPMWLTAGMVAANQLVTLRLRRQNNNVLHSVRGVMEAGGAQIRVWDLNQGGMMVPATLNNMTLDLNTPPFNVTTIRLPRWSRAEINSPMGMVFRNTCIARLVALVYV